MTKDNQRGVFIMVQAHSQQMTMAARAHAERNRIGHRSYRVATRHQSLKRANMRSGLRGQGQQRLRADVVRGLACRQEIYKQYINLHTVGERCLQEAYRRVMPIVEFFRMC